MLFFVDDNLLSDHAAAKELFRALIPLRLRWVSQASIDMTRDPELMRLMVKSGCMGHVIGFESLNPDDLRHHEESVKPGGRVSCLQAAAFQILRDHGLQSVGGVHARFRPRTRAIRSSDRRIESRVSWSKPSVNAARVCRP